MIKQPVGKPDTFDYSKPVGRWCEACNCAPVSYAVSANCRPIPIYPVIPEGERPETHDETHECVEVVTRMTSIDPSENAYHPAHDVDADVHWSNDRRRVGPDPARIDDLAEATARGRR